jgi:hypothetical protein
MAIPHGIEPTETDGSDVRVELYAHASSWFLLMLET